MHVINVVHFDEQVMLIHLYHTENQNQYVPYVILIILYNHFHIVEYV